LVEDPGGSVAQYAEARDALAEKEATIQQLFKDALRKDQLLRELELFVRGIADEWTHAAGMTSTQKRALALLEKLRLPDAKRAESIDQKHQPQDNPNNGQGRPGHEA
jgi:hypothetical protein